MPWWAARLWQAYYKALVGWMAPVSLLQCPGRLNGSDEPEMESLGGLSGSGEPEHRYTKSC